MAGCGSSNLLSPSDQPTSVTTSPAVLPVQQAQPVNQSRIAVAPIMGAPDGVSKDVTSQLGSSLERQRVAVAKGGDRADYTVRGYMVATKERQGTKVAYIFDLTDPAGKRVNRIQGEELVQGGDAKNPWSAITPEIAQRITDKTATSLSGAIASLGPTSGGGSAAGLQPPVGVGAPTSAAGNPTVPTSAVGPTTGSIDRGAVTGSGTVAIVPAVTGAPGDGNGALSVAMRQELQQAGIGNGAAGQRAYMVAGKVTVGGARDGKQSIKIDWRVSDPAGSLLATVSQNNEIQAGSLDGTWGGIAQEAAQGAAGKIKALIDEHRAGSGTASRPGVNPRG